MPLDPKKKDDTEKVVPSNPEPTTPDTAKTDTTSGGMIGEGGADEGSRSGMKGEQ